MARELPSASVAEGVRFTLLVALPNLIQGLFTRRPRVVALARRLDIDRYAVGFVEKLRERHGPGPIWVRILTKRALLVLPGEELRRVLEGAPEPFAADPEPKKRGMSHFQPDALTISRDGLWENRRRFVEAVLDTDEPLHRFSQHFLEVPREEGEGLVEATSGTGRLDWTPFLRTVRRITRRIVLGDSAAEDDRVSELLATLMAEANKLPKERSDSFQSLMARLGQYVERAEPGSLVSRFGDAPSDSATKETGQLPHFLFAMGETLSANAFRALALIVTHPEQRRLVEEEIAAGRDGGLEKAGGVVALRYLEGCLEDAMRLWPTTALLSRESVGEARLSGADVPAGTQLLISNVFNHRDPARGRFADRFSPEEWTGGSAAEDWSFNQFSHGPQGCPGAGLALFVGKALLGTLLERAHLTLLEPGLDPHEPLPHMLDYYRLRFGVEAKAGR